MVKILKYQNYVDKIDSIKSELKNTEAKLKKETHDDFEKSLSKYFKKIPTNSKIDLSNKSGYYSKNIFLLNDEYGFILKYSDSMKRPNLEEYRIGLISIYKKENNNFIIGGCLIYNYYPLKEEVDLACKKIYNIVKEKNVKRIKSKKKREFKRNIDKFNL